MRNLFFLFLLLFSCPFLPAQINNTLEKGNNYFKEEEYEKATIEYNLILQKQENHFKANYNLAAALFKQKKYEAAIEVYNAAIRNAPNTLERSNALYNQANALVQLKKYEKAIENYKTALKENPNDADCRFNLTKAMLELQKQKKQQQKQDKQKDQKKEPPKEPSRNQLQQMDQTLLMLRRKEKNVQERLKEAKKNSGIKSEKDW